MNGVSKSWNLGKIDWLYDDGRNVLVREWSRVFEETGDIEKSERAVSQYVEDKGFWKK